MLKHQKRTELWSVVAPRSECLNWKLPEVAGTALSLADSILQAPFYLYEPPSSCAITTIPPFFYSTLLGLTLNLSPVKKRHQLKRSTPRSQHDILG